MNLCIVVYFLCDQKHEQVKTWMLSAASFSQLFYRWNIKRRQPITHIQCFLVLLPELDWGFKYFVNVDITLECISGWKCVWINQTLTGKCVKWTKFYRALSSAPEKWDPQLRARHFCVSFRVWPQSTNFLCQDQLPLYSVPVKIQLKKIPITCDKKSLWVERSHTFCQIKLLVTYC